MDNIRATLELLLNRHSCTDILCNYQEKLKKDLEQVIDASWFYPSFSNDFPYHYTKDEVLQLREIVRDKWLYTPNDQTNNSKNKSIYNIPLHFTTEVLEDNSNEPVCKYEHLLRWRELSQSVGEDVLTTSFLAYQDVLSQNNNRQNFTWSPIISTDNVLLDRIFNRGLTELHFHLYGSSLTFDISWISLMNDVNDRRTQFGSIKHAKTPTIDNRLTAHSHSVYNEYIFAVTIRLLLFKLINGVSLKKLLNISSNKTVFAHILSNPNNSPSLFIADLQSEISATRYTSGRRYGDEIVDYAIPTNLGRLKDGNISITILYGERKLLYNVYKLIYSQKVNKTIVPTLFYAYLLAKQRFRRELIQTNNEIGFGNFQEYQDRKTIFIKPKSVHDSLVANVAINTTFAHQKISYLEARITPRSTKLLLEEMIKKTDNSINDLRFKVTNSVYNRLKNPSETNNYYYILHFIKKADKKVKDKLQNLQCRSYQNRNIVKKQALALSEFQGRSTLDGTRIVAIDAASTEIGCRPEVFAQAYRFLKQTAQRNIIKDILNIPQQQLGFTYHAGEDYLDIIDGLRSINESILFLNLKDGDRIGHALAMGENAKQYYKIKNKTLIMPKHDLLDNVVWALHKIDEFDISIPSSLRDFLQNTYEKQYRHIYCSGIHEGDHIKSHYLYYQSMLLRGDNPDLYRVVNNTNYNNNYSYWDRCSVNNVSQRIKDARADKQVATLYSRYHFDIDVRIRGQINDEFKVIESYVCMVSKLQEAIRNKLQEKHIFIETNPSSNNLIGIHNRFSQHPIVSYFNKGLTHDSSVSRTNPQLNVSINTDDQGVFSTSLKNEYALMAIALEKEKDEDGNAIYNPQMILDWLENIRLMGFDQRFLKD